MVKTIISDLGNVIVFFDNLIFLKKIEPFSSYSIQEMTSIFLGEKDLLNLFDLGKCSPDEFFKKTSSVLKLNMEKKSFFQAYSNIFSLNESVQKIMKRLSDSHRMVLLSNTDTMRFNFVKKNFPEILFFDEYVLSFEEGRMKPDPEIYKTALLKGNSKPEETVFIDDREENIRAAVSLGMKAILYDFTNTNLKDELKKLGIKI